jgi:hypothetical protein
MEIWENSLCSILFHLLVPGVILSLLFDHGFDLGGHVEDGAAECRRRVRQVLLISLWSGPIVAEM